MSRMSKGGPYAIDHFRIILNLLLGFHYIRPFHVPHVATSCAKKVGA